MQCKPQVIGKLTNIKRSNCITYTPRTLMSKLENKRGSVIYLDGIPGAGKSTLAQFLAQFLRGNQALLGFPAPVALIEEYMSEKMLNLMINNMEDYAFTYQVMMIQRRNLLLERVLGLVRCGVSVVVDRSLVGDAAFAYNHKANGNLSDAEWEAYQSMMSEALGISKQITANAFSEKFIYLDVDENTAHERIVRRNRSSEKTYTLKYLRMLMVAHKEIYKSMDITPIYTGWEHIEDLTLNPSLSPVLSKMLSIF